MINKTQIFSIAIAILLYGCSAGTSVVHEPYSCPYPVFTNKVGSELLTSWGKGLGQYNLANNPDIYTSSGYFTMSYYLPNAILQPTVSPIQRYGTQAIYNYFIGFLSSNPIMSFNPESNEALDLGCGFGSYAGYYSFLVNPGTLQESTVEARFTFEYEYIPTAYSESFIAESGPSNGQNFVQNNQPGWYIILQQSSKLPVVD